MAGQPARPGRGVGDKGEPGNNPSLVQPPGSSAGWPRPISRQLTRPPPHSSPSSLTQAEIRLAGTGWGASQGPGSPRPGCPRPAFPVGGVSDCGWADNSQSRPWISETTRPSASLPLSRAKASSVLIVPQGTCQVHCDTLKVPGLAEGQAEDLAGFEAHPVSPGGRSDSGDPAGDCRTAPGSSEAFKALFSPSPEGTGSTHTAKGLDRLSQNHLWVVRCNRQLAASMGPS